MVENMQQTDATDIQAHLQHHFSDSEQQASASKLGMWLFLFDGDAAGWWAVRSLLHLSRLESEMFYEAHKQLNIQLGMTNTYLCDNGAGDPQHTAWQPHVTVRFLIATLLFAAAFLVIKYLEYHPF